MARTLSRGEIWMYHFDRPDKRRPVVVLTRSEAIELLHTIIVAPITSTIRGLPSEVPVGPDEGLKRQSVVNLDHVKAVERSELGSYVGTLSTTKMQAICRALAVAVGCE